MVNQKLLQEPLAKIQINVANGGEVFKHIFTAHEELRNFYGVEDIEPDHVPKSRQMQQKGAQLLSSLKNVVECLGNEHNLHLEITEIVSAYKELGLKPADVKKFAAGVISFLDEKAGKLTDEQRKEWHAFYDHYAGILASNGL